MATCAQLESLKPLAMSGLTFQESDMRKKIFTDENIARLRAMKALGATSPMMALAIGSKNDASFRARACQLGIFREQPVEIVADAEAA
jgi:hypothetical protein